MDLSDFDTEAYIRRVRWLRRLHNMNQTQFAIFLGVPYKKWHHYESGYPVSRETAFILRRKIKLFTFSTDWLWHGDTRALAPGTLAQLQSFEREERKARKRLAPSPSLPVTEVRKKIRRQSSSPRS